MATNTKTRQIQELRRGNAATPIPSHRVRRQRTRGDQRRAAISNSREGR